METEYVVQFSDFLRRHGMEGVLVVTEQGKILSANRAAESLLGYGAGELTNLYFSDFLAGSHPLRRFLAERSRPRDVELVRRNGETDLQKQWLCLRAFTRPAKAWGVPEGIPAWYADANTPDVAPANDEF